MNSANKCSEFDMPPVTDQVKRKLPHSSQSCASEAKRVCSEANLETSDSGSPTEVADVLSFHDTDTGANQRIPDDPQTQHAPISHDNFESSAGSNKCIERCLTSRLRDSLSHDSDIDSDESTYVCLGAVVVECRPLKISYYITPAEADTARLNEELVHLDLLQRKGRFEIALPYSGPIAQFKHSTGLTLVELIKHPSVCLTAYAGYSDLVQEEPIDREQSSPAQLHIDINIYSQQDQAAKAGAILSDHGLFLQEPKWKEASVKLQNPHYLSFDDVSDAEILMSELEIDAGLREGYDLVLNDLPSHKSTSEVINSDSIVIPLLEHQKFGCRFMLDRELGQLNESQKYWQLTSVDRFCKTYHHAVTRTDISVTHYEPAEPLGGIIADEMGLGKTLTALGTILLSKERANAYANTPVSHRWQQSDLWTTAKCTLVVAPSWRLCHSTKPQVASANGRPELLEIWKGEIQKKVRPGALSFTTYHGKERVRHYSELLHYDLVLTTYGTIAKERCRQRSRDILYRIGWFRLVLDEAHTIRSPGSRRFEAILALQALHHWCLTGTPISNKIDDIRALLCVCRVPLLQERAHFREHLNKAARLSFRAGCKALQKTLAPLCLRRTRKQINLPEPRCIEHMLKLSDNETHRYRQLKDNYGKKLDAVVSGKSTVRQTMLQAILQLRIFCNLGSFYPTDDVTNEHWLDADEAVSLLQEREEAHCVVCLNEVHVLDPIRNAGSGILASCSHVFCALCYDDARNCSEKEQFTCPMCDKEVQETLFRSWQTPSVAAASSIDAYSTKLDRLLQELKATQGIEKSLVLSSWRRTTDLASSLCRSQSVSHLCIDGSVAQAERPSILKRFEDDPTISTLIMTMGTGALGLNITAATRIHILEPQWNPSMEQQAIGRSVRIGQESATTVIRYVTIDTVEEQVQMYQDYKMRLIAGGFGDNSAASVEARSRLLTATFFKNKD